MNKVPYEHIQKMMGTLDFKFERIGNIISASFRSLSAFGQGANSAGVSIGTQLFNR